MHVHVFQHLMAQITIHRSCRYVTMTMAFSCPPVDENM